jgi:predicted DNA binding CopG/RHH family protein
MKRRKIDHDMPVGELREVANFLPPPDQLVFPERTVKVTIALDSSTVRFFKEKARKHGSKYQRMIRVLLDRYAAKYSQA